MLVLRLKIGEEVLAGPESALPYPQELDADPNYAQTTRFRLLSASSDGARIVLTVAGVRAEPQVLACDESVCEGTTHFTILGCEGTRVKIGIVAPADVRVVRSSLYMPRRRRREQQTYRRAASA